MIKQKRFSSFCATKMTGSHLAYNIINFVKAHLIGPCETDWTNRLFRYGNCVTFTVEFPLFVKIESINQFNSDITNFILSTFMCRYTSSRNYSTSVFFVNVFLESIV